MRTVKQLLWPERRRQIPEQFSWIDHALVQRHLIDRCDARAAALYLFLVTVADAQGLSYYGGSTLTQRLHLSTEELAAARQQLIGLELVAFEAPLYQVLAIAGPALAPVVPRMAPSAPASGSGSTADTSGPASLVQRLEQLRQERRRGRL